MRAARPGVNAEFMQQSAASQPRFAALAVPNFRRYVSGQSLSAGDQLLHLLLDSLPIWRELAEQPGQLSARYFCDPGAQLLHVLGHGDVATCAKVLRGLADRGIHVSAAGHLVYQRGR